MSSLNWTDEQNNHVRTVIAEETEKARLSHKLIPPVTLTADARNVPADEYDPESNTVNDVRNIEINELNRTFYLTKLQVEDADLSAALVLIRRNANALARDHDAAIFRSVISTPDIPTESAKNGDELVSKTAEALVKLEGHGHLGPFAMILGQNLFMVANTPVGNSAVLPVNRLESLLGTGTVYRSSTLEEDHGILISLGGDTLDEAVAVPPTFEFLRVNEDQDRECRIFERFAPRLKDKNCLCKFEYAGKQQK